MKKCFMLFMMLVTFLSLFAEGYPKDPPHTCLDYAKAINPNLKIGNRNFWQYLEQEEFMSFNTDFIPDWFDHFEFADNNENAGYSKNFLQEHGGRSGKLVYRYKIENDVDCEENDDDYEENDDDSWKYDVMCSGTLIGKNYFITAGHCAVTEQQTQEGCVKIKHLGVLFGYQKADLEHNDDEEYSDDDDEINDDDSEMSEYPRVSLKGYLDENGVYKHYGEPGELTKFTEHPAYFPIKKGCNNDGSVEHGWNYICSNKDEENNDDEEEAIAVSELRWPTDFHSVMEINKIDYAIYELDINSNHNFPSNDYDPWRWDSENNQLSQNTLPANQVKPWILPDNTNGFRGWARVNTAVLQADSGINVIGSPGVAAILYGDDYYLISSENPLGYYGNDHYFGSLGGVLIPYGDDHYLGLKVVNSGSVVNGAGKGYGHSYYEDILIFKGADIYFGHSGSSVIDDSGRVAGVASWIGCASDDNWGHILQNYMLLNRDAENYATPMWRICQVSQIIKDAARDMDCDGMFDWKDYIAGIASLLRNIDVLGLRGHLINNFSVSSSTSELQNYRYELDHNKVIPETNELPAYTYQVILPDNGDLFYVAKQNGIYYLFQNGTALGEISDYPYLIGSSSLVKGSDIYLAGGYIEDIRSNNSSPYIIKISSDGQNGYNWNRVSTLPPIFEDIRIFALGNDIYVSGNTDNNFAVYKLVTDNQSEYGYSLSVINSSQPVRKDYNLTASDGKIIVSGGATDYIRNVLNLDESQYPPEFAVYNNIIMLEPAVSNNWVTVAENINDKLIMMSVTAIDDGELVIINPFITVGNSMQKIVMDLSEIPINGEHLRVDFEFDPVVYCLGESEDALSGGLTISGECVPFTHPWYNSFSAGATVYSLDGKGERLYVGTNNAIKVYDISDPISPELVSSFSTNSRVNDLEVYGDTLFAATNGGLYKLDASNDTLTQTLFVSAFLNYQYKVEVYNGKLYVGDDSGIKVRDLETMSVLTSVNNGSVLDFAIENGEIGLYKDALFSPVEIRDAETLTLKANEFFGCFEIEVGSSDGRFYLSCDDETYRFEDDGDGGISFTELSGDIRELQDVYTFDGYTYFYDENTIWISTSNDVPAICGNGMVEGDEVCDGGQIDCEELDSNYVSGTATCNSTCDGYNTNNCSDDGW